MHCKHLFLSLFLFSAGLQAAYVGNPAEPAIIEQGIFIPAVFPLSVKVGYQGDWTLDRKLSAYAGARGVMDNFTARNNVGFVSLNVLDRLEMGGSVGSYEAMFSHRPSFDGFRREYETHTSLSWGAFLRAVLFEWGNLSLGLNGSVQHAAPRIRWITLNGASVDHGGELRYMEWQAALGVCYFVGLLHPYVALSYSFIDAEIDKLPLSVIPKGLFHLRVRDRVGLALGCTFSTSKNFDFNLEVRLFSEDAISAMGSIKF